MARIQIAELQVGMVLEKDVVDRTGRMLVPLGATLSEKHLQGMKMWGVKSVQVVLGGLTREDGLREPTAEEQEIVRSRMDRLFRDADPEHELMRLLMERAEARITGEVIGASNG
jgi:hypothetical protein